MRNATAMATATMIFATIAAESRATAAEAPFSAEGTRAEIQIGLCAPPDQIVHKLDARPRGDPIKVWHFDDTRLTLAARGLRLRLRVAADGRSEITLKVTNQDCGQVDSKLVPPGEGKCEYDVYGTNVAGVVSLTRRLGEKSTNDLIAGRVTPGQVLSQSQIRYLREVVGIWPLPSGIGSLGPMQVQIFRTKDKHYEIDISKLPGGEQYGEISRKVPFADVTRTKAAMTAYVERAGIEMCADQSSQAANKLRYLLH